MRLTLKVDFKNIPSIRHGLDLYNETQTDKLIKKIAERFNLSTTYIHTAVGHLINTVEAYRLRELDHQQKNTHTKPALTKEAVEEATAFLKSNNLLLTTNNLIGQSGVIGEELNRLIMYIVFTSRKMQRPLHIISFGSSGSGKSHLQEKVSELIPTEDKIELTSVSGNAFYYYVNDDLGHKVILIEDYDGVFAALYPIRELQSKQKISRTISVRDRNGNQRTLHLTVKGPVCIAGCTTKESIYEDNANRSFLIYLDESEAQDERVMEYQRKLSAGKVDLAEQHRVQKLLQNSQRILQPITVKNPFAESLIIPKEVFKQRRTNAHYIAFIEAITFYNQYQREHLTDKESGEIYIETTLEDIAEANSMMKSILLKKSDELGFATRKYFERLKDYLQKNKLKTFTNKEAREALKENPNTQRMYMSELQQYGFVRKKDGDKKKGFVYEVVSYEEYNQLQSRISTALDEVLKGLQEQEAKKKRK
jgi:ABC-type dipeptide/oligopeptide/nickel transport system ATPase component